MIVRPATVLMIDVLMSPAVKVSLFHLWSAGKFFWPYSVRAFDGDEKDTSRPKVSSVRARFMYWATGPRPWHG